MNRAYYSDTIYNFQRTNNTKILGDLALNHSHALEDLQKNAWVKQILILNYYHQALKRSKRRKKRH